MDFSEESRILERKKLIDFDAARTAPFKRCMAA
jgi:hypothetical protein